MQHHSPHAVHHWPQGAIVYQIYPRSFQDTNGDGVGDLLGITRRLDHIKQLGVTAIWLSPFYPSPMADFGYDVADYCNIDPLFGTLDDFDALLAAAHAMDIKIIVDLVPNHTSDDHPWFQQSRASRDNDYADWYVWRDPAAGSTPDKPEPPNNWRDVHVGGPAWQWEPARGQFYLHSFHTRQPDLNWANPSVRAAMHDVMRFWLDRGVDGFRIDAVYWLAKEPLLSDDLPNPDYDPETDVRYHALLHNNSRGWPALYAYLAEMADVLTEPQYAETPRFMVTEGYPEGHNRIDAYLNFYEAMNPAVAAPFNFEGISLPWRAHDWREFLGSFHQALAELDASSIASYAFGNHDNPRLVSRLGEPAARAAAVLLLTLPGMAYVYNGEEIGMHDVVIPPEFIQDPAALEGPHGGIGRDPERTPMQWDDSANAGFSTAKATWLPVADDYQRHNVAVQSDNSTSFLTLYRSLGRLRGEAPAIQHGTMEVIDIDQPDVLAYIRRDEATQAAYLILVNFANNTTDCPLPHLAGDLVISSITADKGVFSRQSDSVSLAAHEAAVYKLR